MIFRWILKRDYSSLSYFSLNKDAQIIDSRWDASIDYVCRRKGYKGKLSPVCKEKLTNKEKFNYFIFIIDLLEVFLCITQD